ncbi:TIR domain-containing protein [Mumia zhuanghuii]|uniref:TIR domain-containing protein n=2 Tax=Mumia TaxID=1546255 RepID=A0ABW1QQG4_9ACTN|nr:MULTISPECIES: TIR domain-containing protein [Mumia]KAA1425001.1 TIR domain-containing protein [Mumia zhuanghuii]
MTIAFLSYSMRDGAVHAGALELIADQVRKAHEFVYVDILHNNDPLPQAHLEHVLRNSTTLYALQTPAFSSSPWVRRELTLAKRLGIEITPISLAADGAAPSRGESSQPSWHGRHRVLTTGV